MEHVVVIQSELHIVQPFCHLVQQRQVQNGSADEATEQNRGRDIEREVGSLHSE